MIRRAFLLLVVALPVGAAQVPELAVALTFDKPVALTGERMGATLTVTNRSNIEADRLLVSVLLDPPQQKVTITGPAGWVCNHWPRSFVSCTSDLMAANAQAAFRLDILTRNDLPSPAMRVTAYASPSATSNQQDVSLALEPHPATAALSLHATLRAAGAPWFVALDVRNDGPATAHDVLLRVPGVERLLGISGAGWTCTQSDCTRAVLGAGESAQVLLSLQPAPPGYFPPFANVGAGPSFDPDGSDNEVRVPVGPASRWKRVLLPVAMRETPGADGSRWRTDVTAFVDSDKPIVLQPRSCMGFSCLVPQPLRLPFDLLGHFVALPGTLPASFVYTRAEEEDKLRINLHVRDLTRTAQTWGTEVRAVREHEFRTTPIALAPLPVDPLFRTTLRVYDFDARAGAQVAIHVYHPWETTPRRTFVRMFTRTPDVVTDAALPRYPGYLQLDPIAEAGNALADTQSAYVRVEPLTPGLRFWAFASVTNNPTGHVTTVTPQ